MGLNMIAWKESRDRTANRLFPFAVLGFLFSVMLFTFMPVRPLERVGAYPKGWTLQRKVWGDDAVGCHIEARGNYVWVVWKRSDGSIWLRRSTDKGASWDKSVCIENGSYANNDPVVISGSNTNKAVYVIWSGKRSGNGYYQSWIASSNDWGETFPSASRWHSSGSSDRTNHSASRLPQNNTIVFAWTDNKTGSKEVYWGKISVDGKITTGSARSTVDGIDSHRPSVACSGYGDIIIAWQEEAGGSYSRPHLACSRSVDGGSTWGAPGSGNLPYNDDYRQAYPSVVWEQYPYLVYRAQDISSGRYHVGRFSLSTMGASWYPSNVEDSLIRDTGSVSPFPKVIGKSLSDIFYINSGATLSMHGTADDLLGREKIKPGSRSISLASWQSSEGMDYVCSVTENGELYIRRKDWVKPSISFTAPVPEGARGLYFNDDFELSCADAADDFNVTGTDLSTGTKYTNGIERISYAYTKDEENWEEIPCLDGGAALEPPYSKKVDSRSINGAKFRVKAIGVDSAGNVSEVEHPCWIYVDRDRPRTRLSVRGRKGSRGWFRSDASIELKCDDFTYDRTKYRIINAKTSKVESDWVDYSAPVRLGEGKWIFEYRSFDKCGNVEEVKSVKINIDRTAPVCALTRPSRDMIQRGYHSGESYSLEGWGEDENRITWMGLFIDGRLESESGSMRITYDWRIHHLAEKAYSILVKACDEAGNTGSFSKTVRIGNVAREWYFAEGNTFEDFDEYISIVNPGDKSARATIEFMTESGEVTCTERIIQARTRTTVRVKDYVPIGQSVSAVVRSKEQGIVAERPMYFNYGKKWKGGHNCLGLNLLRRVFYFAEGTTRKNVLNGEFEEWLCILNPHYESAAKVVITYMTSTGEIMTKEYVVPPHSRKTVDVASDVGLNVDVSAKVVSNVPVAVERPMYFNFGNFASGGSVVVGAASPSSTWYFAEGSTHPGFQPWLAIQNPASIRANIEITYLTTSGMLNRSMKSVPPQSRLTVDVLNEVGGNLDVSTIVRSDSPVVVERPVYFVYGLFSEKNWNGGEVGMGIPSLSTSYILAEGCTLPGFETFYTVFNPSGKNCDFKVRYMTDEGSVIDREYTIAPTSRLTLRVNDEIQKECGVSAFIESPVPLVVERPVYFDYASGITGGHLGCGFAID